MAANIRCIMRAKAPYGQGITKMKVKLTPEQSSTPSLMPETNSVYLSRPTEGTGELMELVGGTVAWGQKVTFAASPAATNNGITYTRNADGSVSVSGTATGASYLNVGSTITDLENHKLLLRGCPIGGSVTTYCLRDGYITGDENKDVGGGRIIIGKANSIPQIIVTNGTAITGTLTFKPQIFDLTSLFNPTIADYAYSLEQAQAGSGIAWLQSYGFFTEDYIPYSAATLQSVEATSHVTKGKNLLPALKDGTYSGNGVTAVVSNGVATFSGTTTSSGNAIIIPLNEEVTVPTDQCYLHFLNSDVMASAAPSFELSTDVGNTSVSFAFSPANRIVAVNQNRLGVKWDRVRFYLSSGVTLSGTFSPMLCYSNEAMDYAEPWSETNALDSTKTLRGIYELVNGEIRANGDTYEWDGTVTRKYGIHTFDGTENWLKSGTYDGSFYLNTGVHHTRNINSSICNMALFNKSLPSNYVYGQFGYDGANNTNVNVWIMGTGKTKEEFKQYLADLYAAGNPLEILYELPTASQTTESADPFTAVQTVEDGGTEEFVTTNNVPVGVVGRFANAVPMEGVDSFTVTADDGTTHTYPVTLSEEIYRGYVDMLTGEAVSDMASIAEYNGETINAPWLSSLDVYALGATPTKGAQVVYPIAPEEVTATITGDPSTLSGVVSVTSTEGTVEWSELSEIGIKCIMKRKNPFQ